MSKFALMKRPAFQFYPGDWQRDTGLRSCSLGARGLWLEMLCLMHDGDPYGHLRIGQSNISSEQLARMVGCKLGDVARWLKELETANVFSRTKAGTIYSRRMVRDEDRREKRAAGGAASLKNPNVPRPKGEEGYPSDHPSRSPSSASFVPSLRESPSSASSSPSASTHKKKDPPDPPAHNHQPVNGMTPEALLQRFNTILGIQHCKKLTPAILNAFKAHNEEHDEEPGFWDEYLNQIAAAPQLPGRSSSKWHASLDWILRSQNMDKILAGNYYGAKRSQQTSRPRRDATEVLAEQEANGLVTPSSFPDRTVDDGADRTT